MGLFVLQKAVNMRYLLLQSATFFRPDLVICNHANFLHFVPLLLFSALFQIVKKHMQGQPSDLRLLRRLGTTKGPGKKGHEKAQGGEGTTSSAHTIIMRLTIRWTVGHIITSYERCRQQPTTFVTESNGLRRHNQRPASACIRIPFIGNTRFQC